MRCVQVEELLRARVDRDPAHGHGLRVPAFRAGGEQARVQWLICLDPDKKKFYSRWMLVSHALAYISAGKNGVSEPEIEDFISLDDKVNVAKNSMKGSINCH